MQRAEKIDSGQVWDLLATVHDPEIPVLSVLDLGIVRDVKTDGGRLEVVITPTYSGCPAMNTIKTDIENALAEAGYDNAVITTVLAPAWTTDWLSDEGRKKLKAYGIAPPTGTSANKRALFSTVDVRCPRCGSKETECVSEFGSTPCKSLYRCTICAEPFDYFKCI